MSSKITTVLDTILSTVASLYPNKTKIPNPYSLNDNVINFLRDGYGVIISSSSPEQNEFHNFKVGHNIDVIFTREILRTDSNAVAIETAQKAIKEDIYTLQKDFYNVDKIGLASSAERVDLGSTSELTFFSSGKNNFVSMRQSFTFYIVENL